MRYKWLNNRNKTVLFLLSSSFGVLFLTICHIGESAFVNKRNLCNIWKTFNKLLLEIELSSIFVSFYIFLTITCCLLNTSLLNILETNIISRSHDYYDEFIKKNLFCNKSSVYCGTEELLRINHNVFRAVHKVRPFKTVWLFQKFNINSVLCLDAFFDKS